MSKMNVIKRGRRSTSMAESEKRITVSTRLDKAEYRKIVRMASSAKAKVSDLLYTAWCAWATKGEK